MEVVQPFSNGLKKCCSAPIFCLFLVQCPVMQLKKAFILAQNPQFSLQSKNLKSLP